MIEAVAAGAAQRLDAAAAARGVRRFQDPPLPSRRGPCGRVRRCRRCRRRCSSSPRRSRARRCRRAASRSGCRGGWLVAAAVDHRAGLVERRLLGEVLPSPCSASTLSAIATPAGVRPTAPSRCGHRRPPCWSRGRRAQVFPLTPGRLGEVGAIAWRPRGRQGRRRCRGSRWSRRSSSSRPGLRPRPPAGQGERRESDAVLHRRFLRFLVVVPSDGLAARSEVTTRVGRGPVLSPGLRGESAMGYRLEGALLEVCNCEVLCPCWIGEDPDNGSCDPRSPTRRRGEIDGLDVGGLLDGLTAPSRQRPRRRLRQRSLRRRPRRRRAGRGARRPVLGRQRAGRSRTWRGWSARPSASSGPRSTFTDRRGAGAASASAAWSRPR